MESNSTDLLTEVAEYYSAKLTQHGETPGGVDWNGVESQTLRFEQLCKIINLKNNFSINDIGCGYGYTALMLHLVDKNRTIIGIDFDEEKIAVAQNLPSTQGNIQFFVADVRAFDFQKAEEEGGGEGEDNS